MTTVPFWSGQEADQVSVGSCDARADSPRWALADSRRLVVREAEHLSEHERRPPVLIEASDKVSRCYTSASVRV